MIAAPAGAAAATTATSGSSDGQRADDSATATTRVANIAEAIRCKWGLTPSVIGAPRGHAAIAPDLGVITVSMPLAADAASRSASIGQISPIPASARARLGHALVPVLEHLPECLEDLEPRAAGVATRRCVAPKIVLRRGTWEAPADASRCRNWLGLLIIDGLLTRKVEVDGLAAQELLGPGDLLRPWDDDGPAHALAAQTVWRVRERASVALLDERFAVAAAPWPSIGCCLLRAAVQRSQATSVLLAVARARRAEHRLMLLFWHLAERWGRVTAHGVHIPMRLTHSLLAELICLRRPTVSMALGELQADGRIARGEDGGWTLLGPGIAGGTPQEQAA
jgi:CRP/FNR family cyclic AMP-dependent transcriptional regulator